MKKGFKFNFTLKAVTGNGCVSRNFNVYERALQEYFYYKNICDDCVSCFLLRNCDNEILNAYNI